MRLPLHFNFDFTFLSIFSSFQSYFRPLDIAVDVLPFDKMDFSKQEACGVIVQYPNTEGRIDDYKPLFDAAHKNGVNFYFVKKS